MDFSFGNIVASLVFSGVGFVAFMYGKKEGKFRAMAIGGALMAYSYFVPNLLWNCAVGTLLTAALFLYKDGG